MVDVIRVESRDPGAENKTVTGTTFMRFRGPGALDDRRGFQGTAPDAERLVMRPGVQWEQARSPVVWLAV